MMGEICNDTALLMEFAKMSFALFKDCAQIKRQKLVQHKV